MKPIPPRSLPKNAQIAQWARADRALGIPYRQIAKRHGVSLTSVWRWARDVFPVMWSTRWQRARYDKPERKLPPDPRVHAYLSQS